MSSPSLDVKTILKDKRRIAIIGTGHPEVLKEAVEAKDLIVVDNKKPEVPLNESLEIVKRHLVPELKVETKNKPYDPKGPLADLDMEHMLIKEGIVAVTEEEAAGTIARMKEFWHKREFDRKAYALAAPQIGIPHRIFMIRDRQNLANLDAFIIFVNPVLMVTPKIPKKTFMQEGCLSFPNRRANVIRLESVGIKDTFSTEPRIYRGIMAEIIQHEMDHMVGLDLFDHKTNQMVSEKYGRNEKCYCGSGKKYKHCCGLNQ